MKFFHYWRPERKNETNLNLLLLNVLGLEQSGVAPRLGVCRSSLQHWEQNRGAPLPKQMPAIIRFLGYVPFAEEPGFGRRVAYFRKCAGMTQEELSLHAGCSQDLIWRWERRRNPPRRSNLVRVTQVLLAARKDAGLVALPPGIDDAILARQPIGCR